MRSRWIILCAMLLLTGAATTAAIALLTSVLPPIGKFRTRYLSDLRCDRRTTLLWRETLIEDNGDLREPLADRRARQLFRFVCDASFESDRSSVIEHLLHDPKSSWSIYESGWPARSFWGWELAWEYVQYYPDSPRSGGITHTKWSDVWFGTGRPPLIYLPTWRGLILNTLFYAAIWWALLAIPRLIRRTLRARRGLCPFCAYDMRGLTNAHCPECGPP